MVTYHVNYALSPISIRREGCIEKNSSSTSIKDKSK